MAVRAARLHEIGGTSAGRRDRRAGGGRAHPRLGGRAQPGRHLDRQRPLLRRHAADALRDRRRGGRDGRGRPPRLGAGASVAGRARRSWPGLGVRRSRRRRRRACARAAGSPGSRRGSPSPGGLRSEPDDTVLVLGASGTLGSVAVQGAKLLGARRVIGAARRTDLVSAAADEVFDLAGDDDLPEATLIVDCLWGEPVERALAAARGRRARRPPRPVRRAVGHAALGLGARQDGERPRPLALRGFPRTSPRPATGSSASMRATAGSSSRPRPIRSRTSSRRGRARPPAARARRSSSRSPERR